MHEEPIVCTPEDAIRAFIKGKLDYISMGPFIASLESMTLINTKDAEHFSQSRVASASSRGLSQSFESAKRRVAAD